MPPIEVKARLSLIRARMTSQIPRWERPGDNDMLAVVMPRREWSLVRACLSAEIDRIDDSGNVVGIPMPIRRITFPPKPGSAGAAPAPARPGYRRELAFIAITGIVGTAIAWAITLGL